MVWITVEVGFLARDYYFEGRAERPDWLRVFVAVHRKKFGPINWEELKKVDAELDAGQG